MVNRYASMWCMDCGERVEGSPEAMKNHICNKARKMYLNGGKK